MLERLPPFSKLIAKLPVTAVDLVFHSIEDGSSTVPEKSTEPTSAVPSGGSLMDTVIRAKRTIRTSMTDASPPSVRPGVNERELVGVQSSSTVMSKYQSSTVPSALSQLVSSRCRRPRKIVQI